MRRGGLMRSLSVVMLLCLLAICLLGLSGCESREIDGRADRLIEAITDGDIEEARALCDRRYSYSQFSAWFESARRQMAGERSYRIKRTDTIENSSGSVDGAAVTYLIYTHSSVYQLRVQVTNSIKGFASMKLITLKDGSTENQARFDESAVFWIYTVAAVGFCVWMIVDCAKRKVSNSFKGKAMWIIIICAGFTVRLTLGSGGFDLVPLPSLMGLFSRLFVTEHIAQISAFLPFGAIFYFLMRKRLSAKYDKRDEMLPLDDEEIPDDSEKECGEPDTEQGDSAEDENTVKE